MTHNETSKAKSKSKSGPSKFDDFLKLHKADKDKDISFTHTKIGNKDMGIFGGTYTIPQQDKAEFWDLYYQHVFEARNKEYLTEKQLKEDGPLLVDLDLRYDISVKERQHTKDHIIDLVGLYAEKLNEIFKIPNGAIIDVYICEKPNVNILDDKTKDGIHLIFTLKMTKAEQSLLRKKIIANLKELWLNLPIINDVVDVVDEGVTKGFVNWQVFGSRKPGNQDYRLSYYYTMTFDADDDSWNFKGHTIGKIDLKRHLPLMSAQYDKHIRYPVTDNEHLLAALEEEQKDLSVRDKKAKTTIASLQINLDNYDFSKISNMAELDGLLNSLLETMALTNYELKELHDFTMILPESYYGDGSYSKWIRVGWALKNTAENLFLTWLKFSAQSRVFSFTDVSKMHAMWRTFEQKNADGLTGRSIMYWAKTDNFAEYQKVRHETLSYYVDQTIEHMMIKDRVTDFDLAVVLYQLCKDTHICVSVKDNLWYEYNANKWHEIDSGTSLRLIISRKMHEIYKKKLDQVLELSNKALMDGQDADNLNHKASKIGDICTMLKNTPSKSNIMKEAKDLFYDKDFIKKLDSNPYLLCFNNLVVDFKMKTYRKGRPDDFISKSTNIDYIPYDKLTGPYPLDKTITYPEIMAEINLFIDQLFPDLELRRYMWEHLASILIGTTDNQTFNIYTGSGCNGKSKMVELLSRGLGDYKATVPITLITQSRNAIGSASPEIAQLMGVRYAVMQEPSKGEKINEGIMKEITGGDPLQGRMLFKNTVTFIPQFKLVVCTNVLPEIKTNDDGTWRRIRICDFMSKFNDAPYENEDKFPRANFPYQYLIDKKIDEKFNIWAPVLLSMLVHLAFETGGKVKDAPVVMAVSDKYREGQDYLTEFAKEKIVRKRDGKIKKTELLEEFKNWYIVQYGKNIPNGKEITEYMNKTYGKCNKGKWLNIEINYGDESDTGEDENEE